MMLPLARFMASDSGGQLQHELRTQELALPRWCQLIFFSGLTTQFLMERATPSHGLLQGHRCGLLHDPKNCPSTEHVAQRQISVAPRVASQQPRLLAFHLEKSLVCSLGRQPT
jgi:hypothetical protein